MVVLFAIVAVSISISIAQLVDFYNILDIGSALNVILVFWLVLVTYTYVLETQSVVQESRKSNRREYLEHKVRDFYIPVHRFLVVDKANDISGPDNEHRWLTPTDVELLDKIDGLSNVAYASLLLEFKKEYEEVNLLQQRRTV